MPVVGTISGSNGTVNTAISGTLVVANTTAANFPQIAAGLTLHVSGTKSLIGSDSPSIMLAGDTFVSGALGTDSYFQMKPVGALHIPTDTTASYIYTSGTTNDIYFTQYQPGTGYTNTTRLRWIEGSLSTGLFSGGVLSTAAGTTTFSITSGSGIIVSDNASTSSESYPTVNYVKWPAYVSSSLPNIATQEITYIAIDATGSLVKQNTAFVSADYQNKIVIGRVLHQSGSVTNGTITSPTVAYGQTEFRADFIRAFGPIKINGHVLSVNATATNPPTNNQFLGLAKTAGDSYVEGRNYTTNPNSPNYVLSSTDTALTTSKIFRQYTNGSGNTIIDSGIANAGYVAIDPTQYNNAGTLTAVGSGNKFTIQRVYWFPNSVNRALFVYYGNAIYTTIAAAESAISTESFVEADNTKDAAIFIGYIIVQGTATNLGNSTEAKIIQAGSFRSTGTGGGGGSTLPGGSDTQVQFNDAGAFGGDSGLTFNKTTDTLNVAGGLNLTGSLFASSSLTFSFSNTGSLGAGAYGNFTFGNQSFVGVDTRVNVYTGTLPSITAANVGRTYFVKDIGGNCATKNFVILPSSPNKIDGATELKIQAVSGSVMLVAGYDPTDVAYNWYIMSVS